MYKNKRSKREQSILPGAGVGVKVLYVKGKDGKTKTFPYTKAGKKAAKKYVKKKKK